MNFQDSERGAANLLRPGPETVTGALPPYSVHSQTQNPCCCHLLAVLPYSQIKMEGDIESMSK